MHICFLFLFSSFGNAIRVLLPKGRGQGLINKATCRGSRGIRGKSKNKNLQYISRDVGSEKN